MSQTELMSAMQKIYKNQWIATDLSLEQISMVADFCLTAADYGQCQRVHGAGRRSNLLSGGRFCPVGVFYSQVCNCGSAEPVFPPLSERDLSGGSTIVELVPEGEYLARDYDDTQENLGDINKGDSNDGAQ